MARNRIALLLAGLAAVLMVAYWEIESAGFTASESHQGVSEEIAKHVVAPVQPVVESKPVVSEPPSPEPPPPPPPPQTPSPVAPPPSPVAPPASEPSTANAPATESKWAGPSELLKETDSGYSMTSYVPPRQWEYVCTQNDGSQQKPNPENNFQKEPAYKPILMRSNKLALQWEKETEFEPLDDTPMRCGEKGIEFNLHDQVNMAIYTDIDACLEFTRALKNDHRYCSGPQSVPFHVYWNGPVGTELILAIRSFLATQDLDQSVLWIWSEEPEPAGNPDWDNLKDAAYNLLEWKNYDVGMEIKGTPLAANPSHVEDARDSRRWIDSDLFRLVILHNYGGIYFDADVLLLRDLAPIMGREWLYQWGSSCNFANGALAHLHKKSDLSVRLLTKLSETPPAMSGFKWGRDLYYEVWKDNPFDVAPCCFFDLDWMVKTKFEYAQSYIGPYASHEHGSLRRRCIRVGEPVDLVNNWYTERMKQRVPNKMAVKHYDLRREGDGSNCETPPKLPHFAEGVI